MIAYSPAVRIDVMQTEIRFWAVRDTSRPAAARR